MQNSSVECLRPQTLQRFSHAADYFVLVTSFLASGCNIIIIYCAWRIVLRNTVFTHVFIIGMCLGDLLLTGYAYPMYALNQIVPSLQSVFFCGSVQFTAWLGLALSGIFLTAINVDRYIFFKMPMRYILLTKKYAIGVCVGVVASSLCSVTALWVSKAAFITDTCLTAFSNGGIYPYITFIVTTCVLPIVSSMALSTYLYVMTSQFIPLHIHYQRLDDGFAASQSCGAHLVLPRPFHVSYSLRVLAGIGSQPGYASVSYQTKE